MPVAIRKTADEIGPDELTYAQAARVLNISVRTLQRLVQEEGAEHTRYGRLVRFTRPQLHQIAKDNAHRGLPRAPGRKKPPRPKIVREKP